MQIIYPLLADNPPGSNPETSVYIAINKAFPQYGLTQANSKIIATQPCISPVLINGKRVFIQKGTDPNDTYAFYYNCNPVNIAFPRLIFNDEQLAHALTLKTSAALIEYIGQANGLNMRPEDWWCSTNSIDFTGGEKRPNFLLKAKSEAQWYIGSTIISLWK